MSIKTNQRTKRARSRMPSFRTHTYALRDAGEAFFFVVKCTNCEDVDAHTGHPSEFLTIPKYSYLTTSELENGAFGRLRQIRNNDSRVRVPKMRVKKVSCLQSCELQNASKIPLHHTEETVEHVFLYCHVSHSVTKQREQ